MPPKRSQRSIAAVSTDESRYGADPGAFQLPPYWEDQPTLWFNQAEGLMRGRNIVDPYYQFILVQCALTRAQQCTVAHILGATPPPPDAYQQLKAELLKLHEKSEWRQMGELFSLPPLGGQKPSELLATMEQLRPRNLEMLYRWMFYTRLPAHIQQQLAEDSGDIKHLADRADHLLDREPKAAGTIAAAREAEGDVVAAVDNRRPPKSPWQKKKERKRKWSGGGEQSAAKAAKPWLADGICFYHYTYGSKATRCEKPCSRKSEN